MTNNDLSKNDLVLEHIVAKSMLGDKIFNKLTKITAMVLKRNNNNADGDDIDISFDGGEKQ